MTLGHEVRCYEGIGSWSLANLVRKEGNLAEHAIDQFRTEFPELDVRFYQPGETLHETLQEELRNADVVIVHEWNTPEIVNEILSFKQQFGFRALFHDTHHRAYTNAGEILRLHLHLFDGVLAFGEAIKRIYLDGFGMEQAWTFHEAADTTHFQPLAEKSDIDVLWIGNWGDEERTRELMEFLVKPMTELQNLKAGCWSCRLRRPLQSKVRKLLLTEGRNRVSWLPAESDGASGVLREYSVAARASAAVYQRIERHSHDSGVRGACLQWRDSRFRSALLGPTPNNSSVLGKTILW